MSVIRVENLNKSIKGKVILEDLSFTVERGDCLALIGPNGAGKTTFFNLLTGVYEPTEGTVSLEVDGQFEKLKRTRTLQAYKPRDGTYLPKYSLV